MATEMHGWECTVDECHCALSEQVPQETDEELLLMANGSRRNDKNLDWAEHQLTEWERIIGGD